MSENKIKHGQFYTLRNPFTHPLALEWISKIPNLNKARFAEPFGGANNIIKLVKEAFPDIEYSQWKSYDIEPEAVLENQVPEVSLIKQDTLLNPVDADVIITNPPYLAKNSATRMKIVVDFGKYQDLYEIALEKMLSTTGYVAAIIPESFLTRSLFKERLFGFISVTDNLFDDTEFPVGVAFWTPEEQKDYLVYVGKHKVGYFNKIKQQTKLLNEKLDTSIKITYNDPNGILGLHAIDTPKAIAINYVRGETIPSENIKNTSRAITRITVKTNAGEDLITESNLDSVIEKLNLELEEFREQSYDLFLTSFKGLRADNRYRRRLDWTISNMLIRKVLGS